MSQVPKPTSMPITNEWLKPRRQLDGISFIDHLWNRFDGLYPTRWRSGFSNEQSMKNWRDAWASGLDDEGITPAELKRGLEVCQRRFEWPPSFPQFLTACRPAIEPEVAFNEAVMQMRLREDGDDVWSHPAIFWAATTVGAYDIRNASWSSIKARWTRLMQAEMDKGEWPEIPQRRLALPAPGASSPDSATVKALADSVVRRSREGMGADKALSTWQRIKARFEAGESVPRLAREYAEQQLGERFIRLGKGARPDVSDQAAGDHSFAHDDDGMVVL